MGNYFDTNYNARINSKTKNRVAVTETRYREDGFNVTATTDIDNNSTSLGIKKLGNRQLNLSGAEARTLYRVLTKHFGQTGKSFDPVKVQVTG